MACDVKKYADDPAITQMPNATSGGDAWVAWHKILKGKIGKKQANLIWLKAWQMRAGKGSHASTGDLREYMNDQGVSIDTTTMEGIQDKVSGAMDFIGDYLKIGQYMAIGLGIILLGGIGLLVYNVAKDPAKIAGAAASGATKGAI